MQSVVIWRLVTQATQLCQEKLYHPHSRLLAQQQETFVTNRQLQKVLDILTQNKDNVLIVQKLIDCCCKQVNNVTSFSSLIKSQGSITVTNI